MVNRGGRENKKAVSRIFAIIREEKKKKEGRGFREPAPDTERRIVVRKEVIEGRKKGGKNPSAPSTKHHLTAGHDRQKIRPGRSSCFSIL